MGFARRRLVFVACLWLAGQIAGVAAAPVAFTLHDVKTCEEICPALLSGQDCPMHHTQEGKRTCKMRNACDASDAALISLAGVIAVLPPPTDAVSAFVAGTFLADVSSSALRRAAVPESPPPRA
jgi:hypothetical protein